MTQKTKIIDGLHEVTYYFYIPSHDGIVEVNKDLTKKDMQFISNEIIIRLKTSGEFECDHDIYDDSGNNIGTYAVMCSWILISDN